MRAVQSVVVLVEGRSLRRRSSCSWKAEVCGVRVGQPEVGERSARPPRVRFPPSPQRLSEAWMTERIEGTPRLMPRLAGRRTRATGAAKASAGQGDTRP